MSYIVYSLTENAPVCRFDGALSELALRPGEVAIPCDAGADPNDASWSEKAADPNVQLAVCRERLHEQISAWRDEQEHIGTMFEHAGHAWDCSPATRDRLKPVAALAALPEGFFWTDADNIDVPMTIDDLRALDAAHDVALVTRGWKIHARQRAMKTEIESLDAEQLATYTINW